MNRHLWAIFGLIVALLLCAPASAQDDSQVNDLQVELSQIQLDVNVLEETSASENATDTDLATNKVQLEKLSQTTFELALRAAALLKKFDAQITELGAAPEAGIGVEPETVTAARQKLIAAKGEVALIVRESESLVVRISAIIEKIIKLRSANFTKDIFTRHPMSVSVWHKVNSGMSLEWRRLNFTMSNWFRLLGQNKLNETILALLLSLGFAVSITIAARTLIYPLITRADTEQSQPYLRRVFSALWATLVPSLAVTLSLATLYLAFKGLSLLPLRVEEIFTAVLIAIGLLTFVIFLTRAVLAPGKAQWRVIEISESAANRLTFLISFMAVVYCGDYLLAEVRRAMSFPVEFTVMTSFVSALLFAAVLSLILMTKLTDTPSPENPASAPGWALWIKWPMVAAIILIAVAGVTGYISLAHFVAGQILITGAVLVAMYIAMLSARAVSRSGALKESRFGSYMVQQLKFSEISVDQLGLVFGSLLLIAALVIGIPFILLQWGFQRQDVQSWLIRFLGGFNIGDVRISFANIALAIIVFIVGLILTRIFQRWFTGNVLTRTRLDTGVKHSIGAGIGYIGFIVAVILALDYTGIDLSNLALIAGALSVGIGFGLQNVVSNFVSGIILLIERPIRVGDWIVVGNQEGYVKKISVRATELETFDKQSIVIPNAELINTSVGNWMLKDKTGRLIVELGVSYDSNEEEVRDILYRLIAEDNRIAIDPSPFVRFKDFGDNALVFEVRVFLRDISDIIRVGSDLRFAIRKAFRDAGIAIPFPQRDIHVHAAQAGQASLDGANKD